VPLPPRSSGRKYGRGHCEPGTDAAATARWSRRPQPAAARGSARRSAWTHSSLGTPALTDQGERLPPLIGHDHASGAAVFDSVMGTHITLGRVVRRAVRSKLARRTFRRFHARWRRPAPVTECHPVLGRTSRGSNGAHGLDHVLGSAGHRYARQSPAVGYSPVPRKGPACSRCCRMPGASHHAGRRSWQLPRPAGGRLGSPGAP
jgi:hypothetical protein